jgi:hypothetical protein
MKRLLFTVITIHLTLFMGIANDLDPTPFYFKSRADIASKNLYYSYQKQIDGSYQGTIKKGSRIYPPKKWEKFDLESITLVKELRKSQAELRSLKRLLKIQYQYNDTLQQISNRLKNINEQESKLKDLLTQYQKEENKILRDRVRRSEKKAFLKDVLFTAISIFTTFR